MRGPRGRPPGHSVSATSRLQCDKDETRGRADDQGEQRHAATRVGLTHRQPRPDGLASQGHPQRLPAHTAAGLVEGPSRRPRTRPAGSLRAGSEARDGQSLAPRGPTAEPWQTPMPRTMPRYGSARLVPLGRLRLRPAGYQDHHHRQAGDVRLPRAGTTLPVCCPVRAASRGPSGRCRSRRPGSTRRPARARSRCRRCREPGTSAWIPPRPCRRRARTRTRGRRCCP
jgi:hypothetical protein